MAALTASENNEHTVGVQMVIGQNTEKKLITVPNVDHMSDIESTR